MAEYMKAERPVASAELLNGLSQRFVECVQRCRHQKRIQLVLPRDLMHMSNRIGRAEHDDRDVAHARATEKLFVHHRGIFTIDQRHRRAFAPERLIRGFRWMVEPNQVTKSLDEG